MRWRFHHLTLEGITNNPTLKQSWQTSFSSLEPSSAVPDLVCTLTVVGEIPPPPAGTPHFQQGDLLHYYLQGDQVTVHFPRYGQLQLDLAKGTTDGRVITTVLDTYGVLEDLIAISLSPHLRRRGLFLIHAFSAAIATPSGLKSVLLVGGIGAGKTTTGMSLLNAGWRLLSNDSPMVTLQDNMPMILSYPGVLAAYPETFARFSATKHVAEAVAVETTVAEPTRRKYITAAQHIWPGVWLDRAPVSAICFPQIESRPDHTLIPLSPPQALARLLPHAIEQWDTAVMPQHLALLSQLVQHTPTYELRLGPDVSTIPALLHASLYK